MLRKRSQKVFYSLPVRKNAQFPNVVHQLQSEFRSIDKLRQIFALSHSVVLELCMKTFQYKLLNSILYTNTKPGFKTDNLFLFIARLNRKHRIICI